MQLKKVEIIPRVFEAKATGKEIRKKKVLQKRILIGEIK